MVKYMEFQAYLDVETSLACLSILKKAMWMELIEEDEFRGKTVSVGHGKEYEFLINNNKKQAETYNL